ncbi:MAG: HAMP domain-containing sensor histidine kinase [Erysipelothrix sp.]
MKPFKKIFGVIFITFVLFLSVIGVVWFRSASHNIMNQAIHRARSEHESLKYIVQQRTEAILDESQRPFVEADIRRTLQSEYTIGTISGRIVNESIPHSEFGPFYIQEGLSQNKLWLKTYHSELSNKSVLVTQETFDTSMIPLTINLRYDLTDTVEIINSLYKTVVMSISGGIIVTWFAAIILSKYIAKPTQSIAGAIDRIRDGEMDTKVDVTKIESEQAAYIAQQFNDMMHSVNIKLSTLEETNKSQKEFIRYFSHEIKTPLTTIIGYTQQLLSVVQEEEQLQSLVSIYSEAQRLKEVSLTLLKVYDEKHHALVFNKLDREWFEETVNKICSASHQLCILEICDESCIFDESLLYIVILNIVMNAIEAVNDRNIPIVIKTKKTHSSYQIIVENPINTNIDKKEGENFGIGLDIVDRIIDLHQGSLERSFSVKNGKVTLVIPDRGLYEEK